MTYTLQELTPKRFDAFTTAHPQGNWQQTSQMASFRQSLGWTVELLGIFKAEQLVGAALLASRSSRYQIALGPIIDLDNKVLVLESLRLMVDYVKNRHGSIIDIYPNFVLQVRDRHGKILQKSNQSVLRNILEAGFAHRGFTTTYNSSVPVNRWVFVKDLSGISNEDQLLMSYRSTTRQIIKKLDRPHYSLKALGYDELDTLKRLVDLSNTKNKISSRGLDYYQKLFKSFGKNARFLVVYYDDIPLSGAVFIEHPNETVYFISGTDPSYQQLCGGHLLQHLVMLEAIERNQHRYNFYGITGDFHNNPLLTYKAGFRGVIEEYIGGFYKVTNPLQYQAENITDRVKKIVRRVIT